MIRHMSAADDVTPFVLAAMNWRDDGHWTEATLLSQPQVAHYVTGWMGIGDAGVMACEGDTPAGAAWWRTFTSSDPGYGYVADDIPEVGLAVFGPYRGKGLARALVTALVERATLEGIAALSLSVEGENLAARSLYEDLGFTAVGRVGESDTMVLMLSSNSGELESEREQPGPAREILVRSSIHP